MGRPLWGGRKTVYIPAEMSYNKVIYRNPALLRHNHNPLGGPAFWNADNLPPASF